MKKNMEKAKLLDAFLVLVFTGKICLHGSQPPETPGKAWSKEELPLVKEDQFKEHLQTLDLHK